MHNDEIASATPAPQAQSVDHSPVDAEPDSPTSSHWPTGDNLAGYLAEAIVADYLSWKHYDTIWVGGNRTAVDVYSEFPEDVTDKTRYYKKQQERATWRVDAKHSYENEYTLDGIKQPVVSFFGSNRPVQVRDAVTHYALVVFHLSPEDVEGNQVTISQGREVSLEVSFHLKRLYIIPAVEVNSIFRQKENQQGERSGLEQCAPIAEIERFLVGGSEFDQTS